MLPVELKKVVIYSNYKFTVVDIEKDSMQRGTFTTPLVEMQRQEVNYILALMKILTQS